MHNSNQYPTLASIASLLDSVAGMEILSDICDAAGPYGNREVPPVEDMPVDGYSRRAATWLLDCCTYTCDRHAPAIHMASRDLLHGDGDCESTAIAAHNLLLAARKNRAAMVVTAICGGAK